jgi:hypothetical protein
MGRKRWLLLALLIISLLDDLALAVLIVWRWLR